MTAGFGPLGLGMHCTACRGRTAATSGLRSGDTLALVSVAMNSSWLCRALLDERAAEAVIREMQLRCGKASSPVAVGRRS